ncbi:hypothetical protein [Acholeplasma laidlawii]|uniref:hypothetical protein n=1 Tax=Acholeplasma laidlawii TaxID=2148 RepID=UPI00084C1193|nr:hypothetical protein [Acholeplasma laidlawii]OED59242.1 hypothetical protein BHS12_00750 [Acholeplasma laidlawii]
MRKISIGFMILFFTFILVSCSASPSDMEFRLQQPTNIKVEKNILTFSEVEGASSYILSINGENINIYETTYTFTEDGSYKVRIQALSGVEDFVDSLFTDAYEFKVRFLQYPDDIGVLNNQVFFTHDEDADSYDVEINGTVYNSKEDLPPYLEPGTYEIRVKARSDMYNESEFSPITKVIGENSDRLVTKHNYQYSINSKFELPLYTYKTIGLNYIELFEAKKEDDHLVEVNALSERIDYYAFNQTIYFSTSYMNFLTKNLKDNQQLKQEVLTFVIHTNLGDHEITLEINRLDTPYAYNGQIQSTNFKDDVKFLFETFDYVFISVEGYDIKDMHFKFENDELILYADYILDTYGFKRSAEKLEFTVIFEKDGINYKYPIYILK